MLRSLDRPSDAISGLIQLLDAIPTDAEAWCELADLYQSQGLGSQAIFSLEEALLIAPNSWNVCNHAPFPLFSFFLEKKKKGKLIFILGLRVTNIKM